MRIEEARKTFGFNQNQITEGDVKKAYRELSKKYHPDRNKEGAEMMKLINSAKDVLMGLSFPYTFENDDFEADFLDRFRDAFGAILDLEGLKIELVGAWIWVTGETKRHKEELKEAGFFYSRNKNAWYFHTSPKKRFFKGKKSLDEIKNKYGARQINSMRTRLACA